MNSSALEEVVNAVLYEGYILYPYRASSKKNRRERFTFGRVYPEAYSLAQNGAEPWMMQTECLVEAVGEGATVRVSVRFLHPMSREIGVLERPVPSWTNDKTPFSIVPELRVGDEVFQAWHEAVERSIDASSLNLAPDAETRQRVAFSFPQKRLIEPIKDAQSVVGVIVRRQEEIEGTLELAAQPLGSGLFKVSARVLNQSRMSPGDGHCDALLLRTLASTHIILFAEGGAFVSQTDPPAPLQAAAKLCKNIGAWPVLVGDEQAGERETMLSSPIILYDYPKIAPESSGPLFDGTEIDEILTLRILTLTGEEKSEMRRVDEQARRLLERAESLPEQSLLRMHGAMRRAGHPEASPEPLTPSATPSESAAQPCSAAVAPDGRAEYPSAPRPGSIEFDDFFGSNIRLEGVIVGGTYLRTGARVRIIPKARADLMDLALSGQTAVIEAVEQDAERRIHLALVLESDPGRDLGLLRQPGHRFFYGVDEVEPLAQEAI